MGIWYMTYIRYIGYIGFRVQAGPSATAPTSECTYLVSISENHILGYVDPCLIHV